MEGWSFAIGMLAGVALAFIVAGVCALVWLLKHGREEWNRVAQTIRLRRDLQGETHRLVDDIEALERRRKELGLTTPPNIPSIEERRRRIGNAG